MLVGWELHSPLLIIPVFVENMALPVEIDCWFELANGEVFEVTTLICIIPEVPEPLKKTCELEDGLVKLEDW